MQFSLTIICAHRVEISVGIIHIINVTKELASCGQQVYTARCPLMRHIEHIGRRTYTACPSMSPSKASLPVGDPSNARFLEPPEFTISHPKQHVNWFSRFCNVETVANRSTHRHPQTTPLHLCSNRPPLYSAYILHKICIYKICILTEDRDKWRKCVHGAANPRIEDG